MEFSKIKEILVEEAKRLGVTEYDIYFSKSESVSAETLKQEISSFSSSNGIGVSFRCVRDGKFGYASSELITPDEVRGLVAKAYENALYIESDDEAIIFRGSKYYEKVENPVLPDVSMADLKKIAMDIQKTTYATSEYVVDGTQSGVGMARETVDMYNSYGLELHEEVNAYQYLVAAVVNKDGESEQDFEYRFDTSFDKATEIAKPVVEDALSKIGAGQVASGSYDLVLSGKMMATMLATFSGAFSAKNAQLGLSLFAGKEGSAVAADFITVTDDPFSDKMLCKNAFDAEGVATSRKNVIENGVLNTLLYDLATAKKAGKETTANASRGSYAAPTAISPYFLYINEGSKTLDELLASAENGIYITELKGLHAGANPVTGDFSLESAGYRIENGKLAGAVKTFTIAGNFYELLKNIDSLSNKVELARPGIGRGYGSPAALWKNASVAGK